MWRRLGEKVIHYRFILLLFLALATGVMGYFATRVKLSYEFSKAIPEDNPRFLDFKAFKEKFGDDGNLVVIGVEDKNIFSLHHFQAYAKLEKELKKIKGVEGVIGIPGAITLKKDQIHQRLISEPIFNEIKNQAGLDSAAKRFYNLPFYRGRVYNPQTHAYLMGVQVDKYIMNTPERSNLIAQIVQQAEVFESAVQQKIHLSGLPLIRTQVADRIQAEMKFFLLASLALSVLILFLFFKSISTTILSIGTVLIGVVWSVALIYLCGYQITLLTALLPSLVVVIGIPNCIYFINKYHTSFKSTGDKKEALINMVGKMGVVTLFCNITAAIGFAVFAFTQSAVLKEFGVVAGLSIMVIFFVSFILLPAVLYMLPKPKEKQLHYLESPFITAFLDRVVYWVFHKQKWVAGITIVVILMAVAGLFRLRTEGHIVDDLPQTDRINTDLKFFERNFKGVMPLEILVETKKKNGLTGMRALSTFGKVDSLCVFIEHLPDVAKPLSLAEGLKFAKQAFYDLDSNQYLMPNNFDGAFVAEYLKPAKGKDSTGNLQRVMHSFMDSTRRVTRISVTMKDVGTEKLPFLLDTIQKKANQLFDSTQYKTTLTGTSITFLEGSRFIINGLQESILWAFGLIALCMAYLFRSGRIVICSLIPNIIPLIITAGVMGWMGVRLKPSTVLVFSIALGIAVDITIRFLVNYKQELPAFLGDIPETVRVTIKQTGLSIVYTSLVLAAGFVLFCFSSFGGTTSLGWLTSLTLLTATLTNLIILPVILPVVLGKKQEKKSEFLK